MWHDCTGSLAEALEATNSRRGWDFLLYLIILQVWVFFSVWKCILIGGDQVQEVRPDSRLLITVDKTEFCQWETTVFSTLNSVGPA